MTGVLDWRELAPPQGIHCCDCDRCDDVGELEPILWPLLVTMTVDGVDYVTDRYVMIRADLAPVPDGYEGPVLGPTAPPTRAFIAATVTDQTADGLTFPASTLAAIRAGGWRLRLLTPYVSVSRKPSPAVAIVTDEGEHVGWAMSSHGPASDRFPIYYEGGDQA